MTKALKQVETALGSAGRHLHSVSSTNEYLRELVACSPLKEGFYVSSEYQTSGRGQVGNTWLSNPGENLLTSVLLRPKALNMSDYFLLNMSVCLAILDALNSFHPGFQIKWPNDILFDKQKIAGVLIENSISQSQLRQAIVGVGINVNQREWPLNLNTRATSLRQVMGRSIDVEYLKERFFYHLNLRYQQMQLLPAKLSEHFHQNLYGFQEEVAVVVHDERGKLKILKVSGSGELSTHWQGQPKKFQFKELQFLL